jgi:hypothetical protein
MNRSELNYFIDLGLIVTFFGVFITGVLKFRYLKYLLGFDSLVLPMDKISNIHDWSGLIMGLLVLVHLVLHFNWLKVMTKKTFSKSK